MNNLLPTGNPDKQRSYWFVMHLLLVALAYFASARLGLAIPYVGSHITLIWLPSGIAVAALLRWGYTCWPGIFLGALTANSSIDSSPLLDSSISLGNTLAPLLAVWMLRRLKFHGMFDRAHDILFFVVAAAIGMLVSASGGVISLVLFNVLPMPDAGAAWLSWWAGDFIGVLLAAPLLLNISRAEIAKLWAQRVEFLAWCLTTFAINWVVFFHGSGELSYSHQLVFVVLPAVVWAAMRFGVMGSSLAVLMPVLIAALATGRGLGPFYTADAQQGLFQLWAFFFTVVLVELMVVAMRARRKRAEEALLQSEMRFRQMFERHDSNMLLIDLASGAIVDANAAASRFYGYPLERLKNMNIAQINNLPPEEVANERTHALQEKRNYFIFPHRMANGEMRTVEVHSSPIEIPGQTLLFSIIHDISEHKRVEKELRDSEHKLHMLMDNAADAVFVADPQTETWLYINDRFESLLGYSRAELLGRNIFDFVTPSFRDSYRERFQSIAQSGGVSTRDFQLNRKDGSRVPLEMNAVTLPDGTLYGSCRDITERKRTDEALRIAAITFNAEVGILITDAEAKILRVNPSYERISGYSEAEIIGQNPRIFKSGRHDAAFYQAMWSALLNTGKWSGEVWDQRKNGEIYPKSLTITAVYNIKKRVTHYVAVFRDISRRKKSEQEIYQLAFYDSLTKLPNRRLLLDRLQQALTASARSGRHGALLFLDLDHFKVINDTQGHAMGDQLLNEAARRLLTCVREGDSVARLGGDEFVVLLEELSSEADEAATQTELVAEKIRSELSQPYLLQDYECLSTVSIGISLFLRHQENSDSLLQHADVAMYQAKAAGRNAIRFFDPQMQTALDTRTGMEADLRHALEMQQFQLHFQIQVDNLHHPLGAEVLLRWEHPQRGMILPLQFIPLAEETGLIVPIGLWVLQTACEQLKNWQNDALTRDLTLAVNVSAKQFRHPDFVVQVQRALLESGAKPSRLKMELTESTVLENVEDTINKMREIKALGVSFSMDDFGTGYSSLQYLKRLPLNQIKIDQSFVRDIATDPNDAAIVQTIIAITEALGLDVIAEGVETEAQREFIEMRGCHTFQGYLFGRPVPIKQFEDALRTAQKA